MHASLLYTASTSSSKPTGNLSISLFLQLALTAIGLFTLLAVVIIGAIICRRSSTVGVCEYY